MAATEKTRCFPLRFLASGIGMSAFLFVVSLAYYLSFYRHGLIPNDEGHLVHFSERIYQGEVPGRDFHLETYIYGRYVLLAFLFRIFGGPHLLIERLMWAAMISISVFMHFHIGRRLMPKLYALVISLFFMVVPGPWHKTPYTFCSLLGLLAIFHFLDRKTLFRAAVCGLVTGLCLQLRQDIGLLILGVTGLTFILASGVPEFPAGAVRRGLSLLDRAKQAAGWIGIYLLSIIAALAPAVVVLFFKGSLGMVFQQCFLEKIEQHLGLFNFVDRLGTMWQAGDRIGCFYFFTPPIVYLAVGIILLVRFIKGQRGAEILRLLAVFLVALVSMNQAYNHTLVIRLLQCAPPTYLLEIFVIWRGAIFIQSLIYKKVKKKEVWVGVGIPLILAVLLLITAIEIMTSDRESNLGVEYRGSIATYSSKNIPIEALRAGVIVEPSKAHLINKTVAFLQENTKTKDPILVASNDAIYYFLAERRNPSRFGKFFMPGELPERATQVAAQFEENPVQYVVSTTLLLQERRDHPAVRYLSENYVIEKTIDTRYQKTQVILKRRDALEVPDSPR